MTANPGTSLRPRRQRRPTERASEIIAAGLAQFAERGYANTRLLDVARQAGIGKSTLYLYFENKEALFRATVAAHVVPTFDDMAALIDCHEGDTVELLRRVLKQAYRDLLQEDNLALIRIIVTEGERFPELRSVFYDAAIRHGREIIISIVERGIARGEFVDQGVRTFPRLIVAPVMAMAMWRLTFESIEPIDTDGWIAAHIALLLDGLRVRQTHPALGGGG